MTADLHTERKITLGLVDRIRMHETAEPQAVESTYINGLQLAVESLAASLKTAKAQKHLAEIIYLAYQAGRAYTKD